MFSVAQVGVEPTASLVLSQRGLPVAYRAIAFKCPGRELNSQTRGFKPRRSASWRTWAQVVPDGVEPSLPGCGPGVVPLDHGTVSKSVDSPGIAPESLACGASVFLLDHEPVEAEGVRLELTSGSAATCFQNRVFIQPDAFRLSSSGGWSRTNGLLVQSQASLPAATAPDRSFF